MDFVMNHAPGAGSIARPFWPAVQRATKKTHKSCIVFVYIDIKNGFTLCMYGSLNISAMTHQAPIYLLQHNRLFIDFSLYWHVGIHGTVTARWTATGSAIDPAPGS